MTLVREARLRLGMSVPALSRESGVPVRTIENIERNGDCRVSTLAKLAKALGSTVGDLWAENTTE
jgi:transcriptional regulator with XRE-family HTH domain